ncbi:MAG: hypothetical protein FJY88_12185 [Candidatus Eisenbacteria bacterium]|nr:hypothetical protein [Candidatus Eisenbacteria bacterium]
MKKFVVPLVVLVLLILPGFVPQISLTPTGQSPTTTAVNIPLGNVEISITPGGDALAWNLIYELCRLQVPGMCDLYWHGQSEDWWD